MITIREYKTGDAKKIFTMFASHTSYKRDASFWIWINRLLSNDQSIVVVAEKSEKIIGHYAIIPRKASIDNHCFNSGVGIHAFVDPNYRNELSIFDISALAYKLAKERNIDFIYGFPNSNYRLIQEKIEKWKKVSLFCAYEKDNSKTTLIKSKLNFSWELIKPLDFEQLFVLSEILEKSNVSVSENYFAKPLTYFQNRYLLHPQSPYQVWLLKVSNNYSGIIVSKIFNAENETRGHIIDYVLIDHANTEKILNDFEIKFAKTVDKYVMWPTNNTFEQTLTKNHYKPCGFDTFFGIKLLNNAIDTSTSKIFESKRWHLAMGDSDAF